MGLIRINMSLYQLTEGRKISPHLNGSIMNHPLTFSEPLQQGKRTKRRVLLIESWIFKRTSEQL